MKKNTATEIEIKRQRDSEGETGIQQGRQVRRESEREEEEAGEYSTSLNIKHRNKIRLFIHPAWVYDSHT